AGAGANGGLLSATSKLLVGLAQPHQRAYDERVVLMGERLLSTVDPVSDKPIESGASPRVPASIADLQLMAAVAGHGLLPVYLRNHGFELAESAMGARPGGQGVATQEMLNLSEDLLLIRTDWRALSNDVLRYRRWDYDNRGWLYFHFRLDG